QLRARGWSVNRIAAVVGVHHTTISRDLQAVGADAPTAAPAVITGSDGKQYPTLRRPPLRRAIFVSTAGEERRARDVLATTPAGGAADLCLGGQRGPPQSWGLTAAHQRAAARHPQQMEAVALLLARRLSAAAMDGGSAGK